MEWKFLLKFRQGPSHSIAKGQSKSQACQGRGAMFRCVPPCVAKTCAVLPVFARVVGLWAEDPSKSPRGNAANTRWGAQSEAWSRAPAAPRTREPGQSAHSESIQGPREPFPDIFWLSLTHFHSSRGNAGVTMRGQGQLRL